MKFKKLIIILLMIFLLLPNNSKADFDFERGEEYRPNETDETYIEEESTTDDNLQGGDFTFEEETQIDEDFVPGQRVLTRVEDDADLLSNDEEAALRQKLDRISEETNVDVIVHTNYSLGGKTPADYADDYFDYNGYGLGENYDGIIFVLSMEYRDWRISTHGFGIRAFTDKGQELIVEKMLPDLSNGNYYRAFDNFADLSEEYIIQAKTGEAYDVGNMPKRKITPMALLIFLGISLLVGSIAGGVYVVALSSTHKTMKKQKSAGAYQEGNIQFTNRKDQFITRNITRTRIPKKQNLSGGGGGGSSTRTSSSGRSHGGSGGKF